MKHTTSVIVILHVACMNMTSFVMKYTLHDPNWECLNTVSSTNSDLQQCDFIFAEYIMLTRPCNLHHLTFHFYIVKLGFTGIYIFLIFALIYRSWVLVRTASGSIYVLSKNRKNITMFYRKIIISTAVKNRSLCFRPVIVMFVNVTICLLFISDRLKDQ